MKDSCNCCEGIEGLTPILVANRPGLEALEYRVGTHASFLETMKARLSNFFLDIPQEGVDEDGRPKVERVYPLRALTTRAHDDASIAFLNAWATVGDVLTFYQERIANEGFLRTAMERRSILELARLVGYALRPGVASTVYLAYTIDDNFKDEVIIPVGARSQSVPGPDELPQSFETAEDLEAHAEWNDLKPRLNKPQNITQETRTLYFKGVDTRLNPNDPLLIDFGNGVDDSAFFRIETVKPDPETDRTKVTLQESITIQPATIQAATVKKKRTRKARLSPLNEYVASFSSTASLNLSQLSELILEFADDLLETFAALAKAPASAGRDQAIIDTLSDLTQIHKILASVPSGGELDPSKYLGRVVVWIEQAIAILDAATGTSHPATQAERVGNLLSYLSAPPPPATIPPKTAQNLRQNLKNHFMAGSDSVLRVLTKTQPELESVFYAAYRNLAYRVPIVEETQEPGDVGLRALNADASSTPRVYALRVTASLFGGNAPRQPKYKNGGQLEDWKDWDPWDKEDDEDDDKVLFLDNAYDKIQSGEKSFIVLQNPDGTEVFCNKEVTATFTISDVKVMSRAAYGHSGKTTKITLSGAWREDPSNEIGWESILRGTVVYSQSEELPLALEPILDWIPDTHNTIELANLYEGLKAGRWLIVSGERTDISDVTGVRGSEIMMLAKVEQIDATSLDDRTHSKLTFDNDLRYTYERDTVKIYGNVVKATHGETRNEVLGSGVASQALQSFTLRQSPLTFVPASNPRGVESTLHVRVNDIEWHEADTLADQGPTDRKFITRTSDDSKTTVIFGNGQRGARLPTGQENVKAVYRNGIGKAGNVKAEQVSLLATRPLGVQEVINPLHASGGADKESRDQARKNVPLAVLALDRLVSTQDYADFARTFAGIGKASAVRLSDGRRQLVHITIAGADDIPIDKSSDLYRNLTKALREFGDPYQPLQVEMRELTLIVISANVHILPDYLWESVVPKIRTKLLDTFSFERRELGQDVLLSEVITAIQAVEGVAYVDVDTLRGIPEKTEDENNPGERRLLTPAEIAAKITDPLVDDQGNLIKEPLSRVAVNLAATEGNTNRPAQLAILSPEVEATLILNEVKP